jgi:hypothetical protein
MCVALSALCNVLSIELGLSRVTTDTRPNTTNFILVTKISNESLPGRNSDRANQSHVGEGSSHILTSIGDELAAFAKQPDVSLNGGDHNNAGSAGVHVNMSSGVPASFLEPPRRDDSRGDSVANGATFLYNGEEAGNRKDGGGVPVIVTTGNGPPQNNEMAGSGKQASQQQQQQGRETTWQKLSNRIKALERNVSLSTGFLEELSLKYIKQIEELNSQLKLTGESIGQLQRREEACRARAGQLEKRLEEVGGQLGQLGHRLAGLQEEVMARHGLLMLLEVLLLGLILFWCSPPQKRVITKQPVLEGKLQFHFLFGLSNTCTVVK